MLRKLARTGSGKKGNDWSQVNLQIVPHSGIETEGVYQITHCKGGDLGDGRSGWRSWEGRSSRRLATATASTPSERVKVLYFLKG